MSVRCLFDLHVCLHLIRHGASELHQLFEQYAPGEIAISSLTLAALQARGVQQPASRTKSPGAGAICTAVGGGGF